mgnify:CR=1 FL=1
MMSRRSKRELHSQVQARYLKASKSKKQMILEEFTVNTGYHRKYAIRVLKHGYQRRLHKPKGRKAMYRGEVVEVLKQIWEIYGRICSKRLHPYLPEITKSALFSISDLVKNLTRRRLPLKSGRLRISSFKNMY